MIDSTMLNWLVFNSISGTWNTFTRADLLISFVGGAGLASVFVVMVFAFSKIESEEKEIRSKRSSLDPDERVMDNK